MLNLISLVSLALLVSSASAQAPAWGQCGGIGWTGPTTCVAGSSCVVSNPYYSQCIPGTGGGTTTTTTGAPNPGATSNAETNTAAKAAGKLYFGTATDNGELSDAPYVSMLRNTKYFGAITPGNALKWDATEPQRGTFQFTKADDIVNPARTAGQLVRGHTLAWHSQLPSWVSNGGFDNATLTSILQNHATTVAAKYKGKICEFQSSISHAWDVVNEPFNEDGTHRSFVFTDTIGPSYIDIALRAARAADPSAKLYINDYNIDGTGAKSTAMYNLVKDLKARGVPIDGIGIQAHLIVGALPSTIQANFEQFASLGVEIAITELDIRMTLPADATKLAQQKTDYQTVITACKKVKACIGVTIWDFTDKYSWIPSVFSGQGAALPWDENLKPKPAVDGIIAGLAA
ncbi:hypothetical protein PQX77_014284 [Marasmius sp. AFHP31]|nr:hypothetical protein PQX77_014284 [Marasmius sp. AFHP31]